MSEDETTFVIWLGNGSVRHQAWNATINDAGCLALVDKLGTWIAGYAPGQWQSFRVEQPHVPTAAPPT